MRAEQLDLVHLQLPLLLRPAKPLSDEDLMRFSRQNRPYQIERMKEGDLRIMSPMGGIGSTHERYVTRMLGNWTAETATGIDFSPSVGFNLPDGACLSPDAAWISLPRWQSLTFEEQTGYPPLCPDFVIEIRSATDPRRVLEAKMQSWMDNGAQLAWLIDPAAATVTVYRPDQAFETLNRPSSILATAPVAGFELVCAPLWNA